MAHALMLTASSSGRAPVPTGDGSTLLVDDANAVMITVTPNPSSWDPEELTLLRGGQRVATPPMSDGTRWVLMGDDRFGTFEARATAAGTPVESTAVRVVPATVSLRATPAAAQPVTAPAAAAVPPPGSGGSGPAASPITDSPATEAQASLICALRSGARASPSCRRPERRSLGRRRSPTRGRQPDAFPRPGPVRASRRGRPLLFPPLLPRDHPLRRRPPLRRQPGLSQRLFPRIPDLLRESPRLRLGHPRPAIPQ